jgi:UDP-N-acetyl-alpha-D-quinovosamine dehydrogenase
LNKKQKTVLVTGATGFIGSAVLQGLSGRSFSVIAGTRSAVHSFDGIKSINLGDLSLSPDVSSSLDGVDVVIHLAARAHIMNDTALDPLAEFRRVNTNATLNLASQAATAGVKRFVFLSSIKVNGEFTRGKQQFTSDDNSIPDEPYALSKYEAEQGLLELAKTTNMEVVIIRPPLVYGPGVKANFASMMKWVNKGVPLPFGAVHNHRSLVALDNLVSFILHCIEHPKAANEIFLISDDEDISTTELLYKVSNAFGKTSFLIPIPVSFMTFVAKLFGKGDMADRLFSSLRVDSSKARNLLAWKPMITMDEQLKKTVEVYLHEKII